MLSRTSDNAHDVPGYGHVLRGNISFGSRGLIRNLDEGECVVFDNKFRSSDLNESYFVSLDESQLTLPRQPNGDLPTIEFLQPANERESVAEVTDGGKGAGQ